MVNKLLFQINDQPLKPNRISGGYLPFKRICGNPRLKTRPGYLVWAPRGKSTIAVTKQKCLKESKRTTIKDAFFVGHPGFFFTQVLRIYTYTDRSSLLYYKMQLAFLSLMVIET